MQRTRGGQSPYKDEYTPKGSRTKSAVTHVAAARERQRVLVIREWYRRGFVRYRYLEKEVFVVRRRNRKKEKGEKRRQDMRKEEKRKKKNACIMTLPLS